MADTDKVIVSNSQALKAKYQNSGFSTVKAAVDKLIAADAQRHLKTRLIFIDDAPTMSKLSGTPPINATDQRGAKNAVDAIAKALSPDYIVLLDGPDVIPHIALDNPVPNDLDDSIDSDLPYASDVGFSNQSARYIKITRVLGRIPNVPGATSPTNLIGFINTSVKAKPAPAGNYGGYFGLTAEVWRDSTALSLDAAFGGHTTLDVAPPAAPPSTNGRFAKLSHFINCHGSSRRPEFYGQRGTNYPVSMTSAQVARQGIAGTVVAAECCYGAQLYDPSLTRIADPICIAYLAAGAFGFLGSTNIAYGPETWNGQADLLTQFFFENVVAGASLGRSLLQARQRFVSTQSMTDPTNLKTLAQFVLLGDPSTTPCLRSHDFLPPSDQLSSEDVTAQRKARRVALKSLGDTIPQAKAVPGPRGEVGRAVRARLKAIAEQKGFAGSEIAVFTVKAPPNYRRAMKAFGDADEHVAVISRTVDAPSEIIAIRHLVAHIVGDEITKVSETVSR